MIIIVSMKVASTSIAGITYVDDYGVESRYRNVHECDPFYWHPLHLPDYCAQMYERLIRSRLRGPVHGRYKKRRYVPTFEAESMEVKDTYREYKGPRTKQDKLMESLNTDIQYQPSAPVIRMSNIGPVAVYQQPVSKKSEDYIKGMAAKKKRPSKRKMSSRKRRKERRKKLKRARRISSILRSEKSQRSKRERILKSRKVKEIGRLLSSVKQD